MATTIRVGDVIKEEFDRLRRGIESTEGHRITAEEVLARLLRTARSHPEHVVHEEDVLRPWTPEELERFFKAQRKMGVRTDASRYKEELYGPFYGEADRGRRARRRRPHRSGEP